MAMGKQALKSKRTIEVFDTDDVEKLRLQITDAAAETVKEIRKSINGCTGNNSALFQEFMRWRLQRVGR